MRHKLLRWCREQALFAPGDRVILAVSGGPDSMVMAHFLLSIQAQWELQLTCAHLNHQLRGAESDRDEAFVRGFCESQGLDLVCRRCDAARYAEETAQGLEAAARALRYDFFASIDPEAKIATAHTASDNLETVLMHLLRGASLQGLCGIAPKRGNIVRPILPLSRAEVLQYAAESGIDYVTDSTNREDFCLRNRLRNHVVPVLLQENPQAERLVLGQSLRLREDAQVLSRQARKALQAARTDGPEGPLSVSALQPLPPALQRRVLALWLEQAGIEGVTASHLDAAVRLLSGSGRQCAVPGGTVVRDYGALLLNPAPAAPYGPAPLAIPGSMPVPGTSWQLCCRLTVKTPADRNTPYSFFLRYDMIQTACFLRCRQPGDKLHLHGGTKSVKKLLIDRKIPRTLRERLPVLLSGGRIFAVMGVGADPAFFAQNGDRAVHMILNREDETL